MLEIIFDKDTTYQGSIMGIRKISNENEDVSEKKTNKPKDSTRRELYPCLISICLNYPHPKR